MIKISSSYKFINWSIRHLLTQTYKIQTPWLSFAKCNNYKLVLPLLCPIKQFVFSVRLWLCLFLTCSMSDVGMSISLFLFSHWQFVALNCWGREVRFVQEVSISFNPIMKLLWCMILFILMLLRGAGSRKVSGSFTAHLSVNLIIWWVYFLQWILTA